MGDRTRDVGAGEIGDYAFCPRSHWYATTRPEPYDPRADAGAAFHERRLSGVRRRSDHRAGYAAAAVVAFVVAMLLVLLLLRGG